MGRLNPSAGDQYQLRVDAEAAKGRYLHAEADLVVGLKARSVLDAGCGTGRVAIELARRGCAVVGVDWDDEMLATAASRSPGGRFVRADLSNLDLAHKFDTVLLAGNVLLFCQPGTESSIIGRCAAHLTAGGHLVAGFSLDGSIGHPYDLISYDRACREADLVLVRRYSTWEGAPFVDGDPYAVSIHSNIHSNMASGTLAPAAPQWPPPDSRHDGHHGITK
jgi:SAM-dependent methyltransferase